MEHQIGTLAINDNTYPVVHAALVIVPPSERSVPYCLYIHADAYATGGGFVMLDHLPMRQATSLDDLGDALVSFNGQEPDPEDTISTDVIELETSGWTFPGYEDDDSKNWHFESFRADIKALQGNLYRVRLSCKMSNWANEEILEGKGEFVAEAKIGTPPLYDRSTESWT
jgi:hypothetical protein